MDEITCKDLVELVTPYLEDALDEPTLDRLEEHLVMCDWCVDYLEQNHPVNSVKRLPAQQR